MLDLLIISPNSKKMYQDLAGKYAAKEPNIWSVLLCGSVLNNGFGCEIYDTEAEPPQSEEELINRITSYNPRVILFSCYGANVNASSQSLAYVKDICPVIRSCFPHIKLACVGTHVAAMPHDPLEKIPEMDIAFSNEGVYALINLLKNKGNPEDIKGIWYKRDGRIEINPPERIVPQERMDVDLGRYAWEKLPDFSKYRTSDWHANYSGNTSPFASIYTSLGCIFKCLHGDTLVNTINGMIPIRELSERYKEIPVYTYDINKKDVVLANAVNIQKTGTNQKLVRVEFDDGTYIDCTPDHKFLCFKWGNQHSSGREWISEAKDLLPKTSVRAIKQYTIKNRVSIKWGRKGNKLRSILHAEFLLDRKLGADEKVFHRDGDNLNDSLENLHVLNIKDGIKLYHSHISERMKINNPNIYNTKDSIKKRRYKTIGISRTFEQKLKYRESKIGDKNPNYKHGLDSGRVKSRIKEINHKVVRVYELEGLHDTYCMTVPNYGWFFANNVLVKNCNFCNINSISRTSNSLELSANSFNTFRYWSPEHTVKNLEYLADKGVRLLKISDEMWILKPAHFLKLCELITERFGDYFSIWGYTRVSTLKESYLPILKKAGVNWLACGIESSSQIVRQEIDKGKFTDVDIRSIAKMIEDHGINLGANYIYGLKGDSYKTMQETLNLSLELLSPHMNCYASTSLGGSPMRMENKLSGRRVPEEYDEYAFLGYNTVCDSTDHLTAKEVIEFRDYAWEVYFNNPAYHAKIRKLFGDVAVENIKNMAQIKLKRKLLGD